MMRAFASRDAHSLGLKEVLYAKADGIARITINRPARYNAYSTACLEELASALQDATFDDAVGVIVLTGAGDRAFCTGGDVKEYAETYVARAARLLEVHGALPRLHRRDPLDGQARHRADQRRRGRRRQRDRPRLRPRGHGRARLRRARSACAWARSRAAAPRSGSRSPSATSGRGRCSSPTGPIPARLALEWGLVNRVAPSVRRDGDFVDERVAGADREGAEGRGRLRDRPRPASTRRSTASRRSCSRTFPECVRYTKQQANFWKDFSWALTVRHAQDWLALHYTDYEPFEGMSAFAEKRPVDFAAVRRRAIEPGGSPGDAVGRARPRLRGLRRRGPAGLLRALRRVRGRSLAVTARRELSGPGRARDGRRERHRPRVRATARRPRARASRSPTPTNGGSRALAPPTSARANLYAVDVSDPAAARGRSPTSCGRRAPARPPRARGRDLPRRRALEDDRRGTGTASSTWTSPARRTTCARRRPVLRRQRRGPRRPHLLDQRPARQVRPGQLRGRQGGAARPRALGRAGAGRERRHRQRRRAGLHRRRR